MSIFSNLRRFELKKICTTFHIYLIAICGKKGRKIDFETSATKFKILFCFLVGFALNDSEIVCAISCARTQEKKVQLRAFDELTSKCLEIIVMKHPLEFLPCRKGCRRLPSFHGFPLETMGPWDKAVIPSFSMRP